MLGIKDIINPVLLSFILCLGVAANSPNPQRLLILINCLLVVKRFSVKEGN